jgi:hypothetical protein
MPRCAKEAVTPEAYWAQQVFDCLQHMAQQHTNAVLLALAGAEVIKVEAHYPAEGLLFGDERWRAFYHCHETDAMQPNEHGHFHIYTRSGEGEWAHVAGLAIDVQGQPLQWFAVNRWVSDGPWLAQEEFIELLQRKTNSAADSLLGRWLYAMLQLHIEELTELLVNRDARVQAMSMQSAAGHDLATVLEDRSLYTLATRPIALQTMLENKLVN